LKKPFQPALDAVIKAIKDIKTALATKGYKAPEVSSPQKVGEPSNKLTLCQALHMGGGASNFPYLPERIIELFSKGMEVTVAHDTYVLLRKRTIETIQLIWYQEEKCLLGSIP
jgi:hypothetical protein